LAQCDRCGAEGSRYHSCQNRHCPKCQTLAKVRWVEARLRALLPIPYFHCVFTLPHTLTPLAQGNPRVLYGPPAAITGFFTVRRVPLDNALDSIFCIYQLKQMVVRYLPPTCLAAQPCIPSTLKT